MTKILAHEPFSARTREHYAVKDESGWHALCMETLREGDETSRGAWVVRDLSPGDSVCWHCQAKKEKLDNPPPPPEPLPCKTPDKKVKLWVRKDGAGLVHTAKSEHVSHCGNVRESLNHYNDWQRRDGLADEVSCVRCSKAAGLHPQSFAYPRARGGNSAAAQLTTVYDDWLEFTGKYHKDDPRGEG